MKNLSALHALSSLALLVVLSLSGCTVSPKKDNSDGPPLRPLVNAHNVPDAVPKVEPRTRIGNKSHYTVFQKRYKVLSSSKGFRQRGLASWYGRHWHGRHTASGERYDMYAMTAAHKNLPFPTYVRVTNLENAKSVIVKVNDRGPFHGNRVIDLSYTAAVKLGVLARGTAHVEIEAIDPHQYKHPHHPQRPMPLKRQPQAMPRPHLAKKAQRPARRLPPVVSKRPPSYRQRAS